MSLLPVPTQVAHPFLIKKMDSERREDAQVSADGQWVLFLPDLYPAMRTGTSAKIQLIRMDGQGLQTLYCFSKSETYSQFGGGTGTGLPLPVDL
jgi:hypothetical protein